ncbi:uncharacterized protein LY89DRAFT_651349 [Mollisia scopiformis]|uniref:Carboxymuconolactone decarboxylase-like domain-containing protein n=1 Tax=Mollisia scopiformis TaxID=149040 RepID=A0A194WZ59_MOLSC|nr:uncharacterized protein LY89DRAFT_651349 [Mollisia scopiformis]KUJ13240.1 hypothetical protein LY89DRAFT_651349 [Mollisia scopiformis]
MSTTQDPSPEMAVALFEVLEATFPDTLEEDTWYLVALSALVNVEPDHVGTLYTYLIKKSQYSTSESRQALVRRLREGLVKSIVIQGAPKCIQALFAIVKLERPEDRDYSFSRAGWQAGPENRARGEEWLKALYKHTLTTGSDRFIAHKDFEFISWEVVYGLFLSNHDILGPVETELVTLTGIMIQNMPVETTWHLRGIRRLGVKKDDVEMVHQCIELVAKFGKISLHKIPRVADIERQI